MTCWAFVGCAAEWSAEMSCPSHVWARVDPPPSDMQDKGRGPASYPTPYSYPGICFVPVRHRLPPPHTRMLGEGARYTGRGVIALRLCKFSTSCCVPSTCESGGTVGRESFGHFRVFSFSPFSGTGADAPGLPRPPAGHQPWLFQQLGIRCAPPPPKTAHPGARHI